MRTVFLSLGILLILSSCSSAFMSGWAVAKPVTEKTVKVAVCDLGSEYLIREDILKYANPMVKELIYDKLNELAVNWRIQEVSDNRLRQEIFPEEPEDLFIQKKEENRLNKQYYSELYNRYLDRLIDKYPRYDYFLIPILKFQMVNIVLNRVNFDGYMQFVVSPGETWLRGASGVSYTYIGKLLCVSLDCMLIDRSKKKVFEGCGGIGQLTKVGRVSGLTWEQESEDYQTVINRESLGQALDFVFKRF